MCIRDRPKLDNIQDRLAIGFERMPALEKAGIKNIVNGPFTFGPDGSPLIGPVPGMKNYWVAVGVMAGFCQGGGVGKCLAEWIIDGEPSIDVWAMDVARFGDYASPQYGTIKSSENYERRFIMTFPNETLPKGRKQKTTALYDRFVNQGAVMGDSFGLESVDPKVHSSNWLNCDPQQAKTAIRLINKFGKERGERGLPKLLPGLNFIAGLHGEVPEITYNLNLKFLSQLKNEGLWLRRINIRQVEGEGFQEIPTKEFNEFKSKVRNEFDGPLLEEMLPIGTILKDVWWESHDNRTRLPIHLTEKHLSSKIHGNAGITFGRQIGAYPIFIGAVYLIPLET